MRRSHKLAKSCYLHQGIVDAHVLVSCVLNLSAPKLCSTMHQDMEPNDTYWAESVQSWLLMVSQHAQVPGPGRSYGPDELRI